MSNHFTYTAETGAHPEGAAGLQIHRLKFWKAPKF